MRNGQKSNTEAQRMEASSSKELPRVFLPQKFHLATVIALALGLEEGGGWPAQGRAFQSAHLVCAADKGEKARQ